MFTIQTCMVTQTTKPSETLKPCSLTTRRPYCSSISSISNSFKSTKQISNKIRIILVSSTNNTRHSSGSSICYSIPRTISPKPSSNRWCSNFRWWCNSSLTSNSMLKTSNSSLRHSSKRCGFSSSSSNSNSNSLSTISSITDIHIDWMN